MSEIHSYERQQFEKLFKQEKIDRFDDRFKVLEAFLKNDEHITVKALAEILKDKKTRAIIYGKYDNGNKYLGEKNGGI